MRRIITKLDQTLHATLWLLAFTLIPLAVVVGLGREFFPLVANQKAWLEQTLSEQAGVYVRIGDLEGSWPVMPLRQTPHLIRFRHRRHGALNGT